LIEKLETIPVFTATELVLYTVVAPVSRAEVTTAKLDELPRRPDAERAARMAEVAAALGAKNVEVQVAALMDDDNVRFIVHQKLAYAKR